MMTSPLNTLTRTTRPTTESTTEYEPRGTVPSGHRATMMAVRSTGRPSGISCSATTTGLVAILCGAFGASSTREIPRVPAAAMINPRANVVVRGRRVMRNDRIPSCQHPDLGFDNHAHNVVDAEYVRLGADRNQ